eukprot:scaffold10756_cov62-Attheya_sp.AAC.5
MHIGSECGSMAQGGTWIFLKNPPENREEGGGVWDEESYEGKKFRCQFRIPFGMFVDHLAELKLRFGDEFPQHVGEEHWCPVELLIMGSLLQLATGMKPFWLELCTELALEEITMPETGEEIEHVMGHYRSIGLSGIASMFSGTSVQLDC